MGGRLTVVLDTAVVLYRAMAPERLSQPALEALRSADSFVVSAISFWEIALKSRRGRLALPVDIRDFVSRVSSAADVDVWPVDVRTWLANVELDWDHRDPADRTIVATAAIADAPIVTSDRRILDYYPRAIW